MNCQGVADERRLSVTGAAGSEARAELGTCFRGDLAVEMSEAVPLFSGRLLEGFAGLVHVDVGRAV